jgi:hypothetical protein
MDSPGSDNVNDVQFELEVTLRTKGGKRIRVGIGSATAAPNPESLKEAAMDAVMAALQDMNAGLGGQRVPA